MNETNLSGKTAVVLGASSLCGRATARMLASRGVNLALGGRSRGELESLQEEISAFGGQVLVVGTHLAKRHHPAHLVEAALEEYGGLDILLFMAHATAPPLDSLDLDAWERSIDVNIKGFMYCLSASLPALAEDEGGCIAVLNIGEREGMPDPLLRASQAALRTILEEISGGSGESFEHPLRAIEVCSDAWLVDSPERCAQTMVNALDFLPETNAGLFKYRT
ncbi:MAG: SDR family NAD(P)-dependent oxidoreductase [Rubrobacteraceae bacterium]